MKHLYILFLFLTFSAIAQDKTVVMPNASSIPEWVQLTEIESTLTPGSVIFAGTSGVLSQDATNLFFENSTDRMGIGANAGSIGTEASLTTVRSFNGNAPGIWSVNASTGTSAASVLRAANNAGNVFDMRMHSTTHSSLPAAGMMLATGSGGLYLSTESTQTIFVSNSGSSNILARFTNTGVGIAGVTVPSAMLHLPAGTATAGTAPMKLTTGTALTTPSDGALEYHSSHLYFTIGSTRYQLDQQGGGGITNSAANTEVMVSDGTNAVGTTLFSASDGNLTLGDGSLAGTERTLAVASSVSSTSLSLVGKSGSASIANDVQIGLNSGGYVGSIVIGAATAATNDRIISAASSTSSDGVGMSLRAQATGSVSVFGSDLRVNNIVGTSATLGLIQIGTTGIIQSPGSTHVDYSILLGDGNSSTNNGRSLTIEGGAGYITSGNGNGGSITIQSGERRTAGSGTDGNITIDTLTGFLIISTIPTSSAGLPSGAVWANSNVLTIVP